MRRIYSNDPLAGIDEYVTRDNRQEIPPTKYLIEGYEEEGTFEDYESALSFALYHTDIKYKEYPTDYIYEEARYE